MLDEQPWVWAVLARGLSLAAVVMCFKWMHHDLEGFALKPDPAGDGANHTERLFNLHPLFMILAWVACATEAFMAFHTFSEENRPRARSFHIATNSACAFLTFLGFLAVYKSNSLKLPKPYEHFHTAHS